MLATLVASLGDCLPDVECHPSFWLEVVLPTVLVAAPIGFGVRWLVNRRRSDDGQRSAADLHQCRAMAKAKPITAAVTSRSRRSK
jgi:hypothetical protein